MTPGIGRWGYDMNIQRRKSPEQRFWEKVHKTPTCWLWTGALAGGGYGHFYVGNRQTRHAHLVAYEWLVGPIPEGKQLDHLCRNRSCVNPDHLEPVTQSENILRGLRSALKPEPTHCRNGHPYTAETLRFDKAGKRNCRMCQRASKVRYRERQQQLKETA